MAIVSTRETFAMRCVDDHLLKVLCDFESKKWNVAKTKEEDGAALSVF